jgi:glycosyltransferase involved in cell wall biosynthesis
MRSILVITPSSSEHLQTQGTLIARKLREDGVQVDVLTRAKSSWGRLLDIIFRGFFLMPRYDSVLINVYGERAFVYETAAIMYGRFWKKHTVALIRSGLMPKFVQKWPRWTRTILSLSNLVLVPHDFLKLTLSNLGIRIDGVLPNFIELEKYKFRERTCLVPRFLFLRGAHPIYNPEMALRAFALVQRRYPDALLTIAGPGTKNSISCQALVQALNLRNVHFVGQVLKEEVPTLADEHDIHLHTNRVENMPVSIIEMWACGLPIVGTNVGGMPYLVRNGQDTILVESEDYKAMADACIELLSNRQLANMLSRNGRRRAEQLIWESVKPKWERALLLNGKISKEATAHNQEGC